MTEISLSRSGAAKVRADAVVVGVTKGPSGPQITDADVAKALGRAATQQLRALGVEGKAGEVVRLPAPGSVRAPVLVAAGLGDREGDLEALRRAAGAAVRSLAGKASVALALPADDRERLRAVLEGAALGAYRFDTYRTANGGDAADPPVGQVTVLTDLARGKEGTAAVTRAEAVAAAVRRARDWINTPAADLTPLTFAEQAVELARSARLDVEVLDEKALTRKGYGGILGVGRGSTNPPRLVRLSYRPRKPVAHVAFVGKGITFDSGGLSLKDAKGMTTMKCDMSGAAAVLAATRAVADLDLPVRVTGYAPLAENMPSGQATRPSDILSMYGGTTVEVLNTDAEGRLVLGDGLAKASEDKPDLLVDVATLTGACVVALGTRVGGIMSNDDALLGQLQATAERAGEVMWPLPIPEEMKEKISSKVADLRNTNFERWGGALYAAAFLREFVGAGIRWAHLDIAGPAFNEDAPYGYTPRGGTGAGVRTLVQLAEDLATGRFDR